MDMGLSVWRNEGLTLAAMERDHFPAQVIDHVGADTLISSVRLWQVNVGIFAGAMRITCAPGCCIDHQIGLAQSLYQFRNASSYPYTVQPVGS